MPTPPRRKPTETESLIAAIDASRLTDFEVCRLSGVTPTTLSNWRTGRHQPSRSTQAMIWRVLARGRR